MGIRVFALSFAACRVTHGVAALAFVASVVVLSVPGCFGGDELGPCANTGCGPAPFCDEGCLSQCGCCGCYPGEQLCREGKIYSCSGGCYGTVKTCSSSDACVTSSGNGSAFCAESVSDCPAIRRAYGEHLAQLQVTVVAPGAGALEPGVYNAGCLDADCVVQAGHCETGLGPCWFLGRSDPLLERYAALYARLGCTVPTVCDCPPPDLTASCERDEATQQIGCVVR